MFKKNIFCISLLLTTLSGCKTQAKQTVGTKNPDPSASRRELENKDDLVPKNDPNKVTQEPDLKKPDSKPSAAISEPVVLTSEVAASDENIELAEEALTHFNEGRIERAKSIISKSEKVATTRLKTNNNRTLLEIIVEDANKKEIDEISAEDIIIKDKDEEFINTLIEYNNSCNPESKAAKLLLLYACTKENSKWIDALLKAKVDIAIADVKGHTPLYLACFYFKKLLIAKSLIFKLLDKVTSDNKDKLLNFELFDSLIPNDSSEESKTLLKKRITFIKQFLFCSIKYKQTKIIKGMIEKMKIVDKKWLREESLGLSGGSSDLLETPMCYLVKLYTKTQDKELLDIMPCLASEDSIFLPDSSGKNAFAYMFELEGTTGFKHLLLSLMKINVLQNAPDKLKTVENGIIKSLKFCNEKDGEEKKCLLYIYSSAYLQKGSKSTLLSTLRSNINITVHTLPNACRNFNVFLAESRLTENQTIFINWAKSLGYL